MAGRERVTVGKWARRALRTAGTRQPLNDPQVKIKAIRKAAEYSFPTAGIQRHANRIRNIYIADQVNHRIREICGPACGGQSGHHSARTFAHHGWCLRHGSGDLELAAGLGAHDRSRAAGIEQHPIWVRQLDRWRISSSRGDHAAPGWDVHGDVYSPVTRFDCALRRFFRRPGRFQEGLS